MENNVYTYRQILIGLRNEYLIVKKELEELNKYIVNNSKSNCECHFRLGIPLKHRNETNANLMISANKRKKELFYKSKYIMQAFGIIKRKQTLTEMIKNECGIYLPKKIINGKLDKRFDISILSEKEKEFAEKVDVLRNSDFSKFMYYSEEELSSIIGTNGEHIWHTSTDYSQSFSNDELFLKYIGLDDIIELGSVCKHNENFKPITNEILQKAMNTEFPKSAFSDYHRKIIDSYLSLEKQIIFSEDYLPIKHSKFTIEEKGMSLVLHKIK